MAKAGEAIAAGAIPEPVLKRTVTALTQAGFAVEYLELRDAATLSPVAGTPSAPARLLAAVQVGHTRLIDNVPINPRVATLGTRRQFPEM
jgi:pantoate--beta-alanine ligase